MGATMLIKQNKGKDIHKIPDSRLVDGPYWVSKKFDGHYVQIRYHNNMVEMWTSGGKMFYLSGLADYIKEHFTESFHIECEFSYNCNGYLGDRGKSAILTTYRTNHSKGIDVRGDEFKDVFRVLDIIDIHHTFKQRHAKLTELFYGHDWFDVPTQHIVNSLQGGKDLAKLFVEEGYEGAMLKSPDHMYKPGKRSNNIIKIKPRLTADLLCVDVKEGTGKYEGMIGALLLKDSQGRHTWAGSGLNDTERSNHPQWFIGKIVEIEYERIDETYIQPIIKYFRDDKTESD